MKDLATKAIWEPAMTTELDYLLNTKTIGFIRKSEVPQGCKIVYLQIVVSIQ